MAKTRRRKLPRRPGDEVVVTTSLSLPKHVATLLRRVAFSRAQKAGQGRVSVSGVIRDLVERHRRELEREANDL